MSNIPSASAHVRIATTADLNAFIATRPDNGCSKSPSCFTCPESDCHAPKAEAMHWNARLAQRTALKVPANLPADQRKALKYLQEGASNG